jgi:hypothetical protein
MRKRRTFTSAIGLAVVLAGAITAVATANPLLSGYSGPGQGSQAILGSALLNTPAGGGGGPSAGAQAGATPTLASPRSAGASAPGPSSSKHSATGKSAKPAPASAQSTPFDRGAVNDSQSGVLGLSGTALLEAILVLAAIALLALLTRRLAAREAPGQHHG